MEILKASFFGAIDFPGEGLKSYVVANDRTTVTVKGQWLVLTTTGQKQCVKVPLKNVAYITCPVTTTTSSEA